MTRRESATVIALVDAVVAPEPPLPPVPHTDAVEAFGEMLRRAPRLNAVAMRVALLGLRSWPRMSRPERFAALSRLERRRWGRPLIEALRTAAAVSYYGDAGVLAVLER